jgi:hypothetical protein
MARLENVERISKDIFTLGGYLTIKHQVATGKKGRDDVKLHGVYDRTYNSTKYSSHNELTEINISTSDFIVFAYNDFKNSIREEVFISYPHFPQLLKMCDEVIQMSQIPDLFNNQGVNPKYQNSVITADHLGQNKKIGIVPHMFYRDQDPVQGAIILINSNDVFVEVDMKTIVTMANILRNYDMMINSALILQTGLIYDNAGLVGGSAPAPGNFRGNNNSNNNRRPAANGFGGGGGFGNSNNNRNSGGGFGNNGGGGSSNIFGKSSGGGNSNVKQNVRPPAGNNNNTNNSPAEQEINLDELENAVQNGDVNFPFENNAQEETNTHESGGGGTMSLNDIVSGAKEIEVPNLEDGEINFDE